MHIRGQRTGLVWGAQRRHSTRHLLVGMGLALVVAGTPAMCLADRSSAPRSERIDALLRQRQQRAQAREQQQKRDAAARRRGTKGEQALRSRRPAKGDNAVSTGPGKHKEQEKGRAGVVRRVTAARQARQQAADAKRRALVRQVKNDRQGGQGSVDKARDKARDRTRGRTTVKRRGLAPTPKTRNRQPRNTTRNTTRRTVRKTVSAPGKPLRACTLVQREVPRGGRLDVSLPNVGRAPIVRVGGRVSRMLTRRQARIAVQVPRDSRGGPVTVRDGGRDIACGNLTIIGLD